MMKSTFAQNYADYLERGYSILPIAPGQKFPGEYDGQCWSPAKGWNRWCARPMTDLEVEVAESWPNAGIGLALGKVSNIIAIDRDYDGGVGHILDELIPPSPVRKVGEKGYTAFFRYNGEISRKWSVGGECVLELHSNGKQTVLPPSIHPSTGKPYYWATEDTLADIDLEDIPYLPLDFCDRVDAALAPYNANTICGGNAGLGSELEPEEITPEQFEDIRSALGHIPADDRDVWIRIGMALKTIGDRGFFLWDNWSKRSDKYDQAAAQSMATRWAGFKVLEHGISYRTIFAMAGDHGWRPPHSKPDTGGVTPLIEPGTEGNLARAALDWSLRSGTLGEEIEHTVLEESHTKTVPNANSNRRLQALWGEDIGDLTPTDWLVQGILTKDSLAMIYGPPGGGKTFAGLDLALSVATGTPYWDRKVKKGRVLYIAGEGRHGIKKRVRAWCMQRGLEKVPDTFGITICPVQLTNRDSLEELLDLLREIAENTALIIVDTVARNFGDGDENSTKDMGRFVEALDQARMLTSACILVIHHSGKDSTKGGRGSSSLKAALDTEISLVTHDGGFRMSCTKQKDAEPFEPLGFDLEKVSLGTLDGESIESLVSVANRSKAEGFASAMKKTHDQKMELKRRVTILREFERIGAHIGRDKAMKALERVGLATFRSADYGPLLTELASLGYLKPEGKGRYSITPDGIRFISESETGAS